MDNKTLMKRLVQIRTILDSVYDLDSIDFDNMEKRTFRLMVEVASMSGHVEQANTTASFLIKTLIADIEEDQRESERLIAKYQEEHGNV